QHSASTPRPVPGWRGDLRLLRGRWPRVYSYSGLLEVESSTLGESDHSRMARVSRNASIPYRPYSRPTPEYLNPPQGACGSSVMLLITMRPDRIWEATRRARATSVPRMAAWRPYLESLAIRIASSSES